MRSSSVNHITPNTRTYLRPPSPFSTRLFSRPTRTLKQDLVGAQTKEEIAEALDLNDEIFEKRHWKIQACSAVTGEGLVEGMSWLTDDISSRIYVSS